MAIDWTRTDAREVCLEVLATASVCGVPMEARPDVFADAIGRRFTQDYFAGGRSMTRDFGLLTAAYYRAGERWVCDGLTVRVNRLDKPFQWRRIPDELQAHGFGTVDVPQWDDDVRRIGVSASGVEADVTVTDYYQPAGRILHITAWRRPYVEPLFPDRRGELRNRLRAIAGDGPPGWGELLTGDVAAWLAALGKLHADQPARDEEWTALSLWLLDRARETKVWPVPEWTYRWATYVSHRPGLVAPGEVTRACLASLPMDLAEARALPAGWREIGPDAARRARMTRALLRIAAEQAPGDAGLTPWRTGTTWVP